MNLDPNTDHGQNVQDATEALKGKTFKERLRSTVFYGGVGSSLILIAQPVSNLMGYELSQETVSSFVTIFNGIIGVLTLGGALVNPSKVQSFQAMSKKKDSFKAMISKRK